MLHLILFYGTVAAYLLGTVANFVFIGTQKTRALMAATHTLFVGFGLHSVAILVRFFEMERTPGVNRYESLSLFAWVIVGAFLLVRKKSEIKALGAFISPMALILTLAASVLPKDLIDIDAALIDTLWFPAHVGTAFIGDAIFALAAVFGAMYLIQERQLKSKKFGPWYHRLPSLNALDELNHRCLSVGFPFLTVGMITGSIWLHSAYGILLDWSDARQTSSLMTWFLYAALIHGRFVAGWRGRRTAVLAMVGFALIVVTYFGLGHFFQGGAK